MNYLTDPMTRTARAAFVLLLAGPPALVGCSGGDGATEPESLPWPVASVTVEPVSAALTIGQSRMLLATVRNSAGAPLTLRAISWQSSDTTIAIVSGVGLVTGVGAGTATVTAWSEGKSGVAQVAVDATR